MAERLLFAEPSSLSDVEERELQILAAKTQRTTPLTPETAYLKARDVVGGESFLRAREELSKLDKLDRIAERALNDYEERLERGLIIGRILPNNAINLRRLYIEHQRARTAYNDSARRFEHKLTALRSPEARAKIRELATDLISDDHNQRVTVREAGHRLAIAQRYSQLEQPAQKNVVELSVPVKRVMKPRV